MKHTRLIFNKIFFIFFFLLTFACIQFAQTQNVNNAYTNSVDITNKMDANHPLLITQFSKNTKPTKLLTVTNFLYQLDNIDLTSIGNTAFDLVIVDYSSTGDNSGEFTSVQIENLKNSPGGKKIVIAYMSIGEAEDYRFYWNSSWTPGNPSWLSEENPNWPGNFKVKYWDPSWQNIIYQYVDKIISAGFDGVYLDIIDAYEYYEEDGRNSAAQDMVNFVTSIAEYARTFDPDFLVIPQNAAELAAKIPTYLNAIDGIGQEDIYYGYDFDGLATPNDITKQLETYLNVFKDANKLVLTIDYPFSNSEDIPHFDQITLAKINNAYSQSLANGYVPYCSVRNLNFLTINPGFNPTAFDEKKLVNTSNDFDLFQNYPNPFNPSTILSYQLPNSGLIVLKVYDILGKEIITLVNRKQQAGKYEISFDAKNLPSGVYFYKLKTKDNSITKKMLLLE